MVFYSKTKMNYFFSDYCENNDNNDDNENDNDKENENDYNNYFFNNDDNDDNNYFFNNDDNDYNYYNGYNNYNDNNKILENFPDPDGLDFQNYINNSIFRENEFSYNLDKIDFNNNFKEKNKFEENLFRELKEVVNFESKNIDESKLELYGIKPPKLENIIKKFFNNNSILDYYLLYFDLDFKNKPLNLDKKDWQENFKEIENLKSLIKRIRQIQFQFYIKSDQINIKQ